jgi:hypothetical protein
MLRRGSPFLLTSAALFALAGCGPPTEIRALDLTFAIATSQEMGPERDKLPASMRGMLFDADTLVCRGGGEYRKFTPDSEVTVRDERRRVIARGPLGTGQVMVRETLPSGANTYRGCRFRLQLPLESPARIYTIEAGDGEFVRSYHHSSLRGPVAAVLVDLE